MSRHAPLGGQALMEGVMIKAPKNIVMAARTPNGRIVTKVDKFKSLVEKYRILKLPFLRGVVFLGEMLVVGTRALTWSANIQEESDEKLGPFSLFLTFAFAAVLTVGIFIVAPYYLARVFAEPPSAVFNILDGLFRLVAFIAYIALIGLMKDVRRMFEYHGAEHMSVYCHEAGKPLTVKNVSKYRPEHPRCGTSLLVYVVGLSIILFSFIRTGVWWVNLSVRVILIPVIAGISYEFLRFSAKYQHLTLFRWMTWPGLWTQKLTTRKPDAGQIEVAIAAVKRAR